MFSLLFLCLFGVALSTTTTHRPHSTHEPNEHHSYRFVYDNHSYTLVLIDNHVCYQYVLSDTERPDVHTDTGLKTLEFKMLSMVAVSNFNIAYPDSMPDRVQHVCAKATAFYTLNP